MAATVEMVRREGEGGTREVWVVGETVAEAWPEEILVSGELLATVRGKWPEHVWVIEDALGFKPVNGEATYELVGREDEEEAVYRYRRTGEPTLEEPWAGRQQSGAGAA